MTWLAQHWQLLLLACPWPIKAHHERSTRNDHR
jgi:hypothetical protein